MNFKVKLAPLTTSPAIIKSLANNLIGLEKECLRVAQEGGLSQQPHPKALGAPLTHSSITTDYSEALLELITPPLASKKAVMENLSQLHQFVYQNLENKESLWATSMPCVVDGDQSIPIAQYGTSNIGQMKHIYRVGLANRYGRMMQVIAGVHYNFSVAESFWAPYQQINQNTESKRQFKDNTYMGMVRNIQRFGWIIPYLFGASPAICKSFLQGCQTKLQHFDKNTYYEPFATSLRLGNIGYQNSKEEGAGVDVCYCSLDSYVQSLQAAISTPAKAWTKIDENNMTSEYQQLNDHILQIENEYYSTVRPKQILKDLEKPTDALQARGIQYVELRSLDVNVFAPMGICEIQLYFIEIFMLYCLLKDSPIIDKEAHLEINNNLLKVAHKGRQPDLTLTKNNQSITLQQWGTELINEMQGVCDLLVKATGKSIYQQALNDQQDKFNQPDLTPSAKMLAEMREHEACFYEFVKHQSVEHQQYFADLAPLNPDILTELTQKSIVSWQQQNQIEAEEQVDFATFLATYFAPEYA